MGSQPDHKAAFSALIDACAYTVIDVKKHLDEQKESDATEVRRQEEEKRQKEQMARLAAEQEEKDRLDRVWKMAEEREAIAAAEHDLEAKKEVLRITQKAADMDGDDEDDKDDDEKAATIKVANPLLKRHKYVIHYSQYVLIIITSHIRGLQRRNPSVNKGRLGKRWNRWFMTW